MGCDVWREALSARLDGEDLTDRAGAVDAHLASCAACRRWYADAAVITRIARIGLAVPGAGVPESVLDSAPRPTRARLARNLRGALALIGGAQLLLGVDQLANLSGGAMTDATMAGTTPAHLVHESAAWNLAIGAGFLFVAWRRTRPAGVLPMLSVFVAVLTVMSVGDALDGMVAAGRLATHLLMVAGYVIVLALSRPSLTFDSPSGARRGLRRRWRLETADDPVPAPGAAGRHATPAATVPRRAA